MTIGPNGLWYLPAPRPPGAPRADKPVPRADSRGPARR